MTMRLRDFPFETRYRSDLNDVVRDFYANAFERSNEYSRAVGYFTSTSLALVSRGLEDFAGRNGTIRIIASPHLELDDIADIERGYELRDVLTRSVLRTLDEQDPSLLDGLGTIGRLIASGHLDIRLAFFERKGQVGLYHEKLGVFRDAEGDTIAFTGSGNETYGGLVANFESAEVFRSWDAGDAARVARITSDFERLWANTTPKLSVLPFPDIARDRLIAISRERPPHPLPVSDEIEQATEHERSNRQTLTRPLNLEPRDYQKEAIRNWLANGGRGVFKLATGTGKTKTALMAASLVLKAEMDKERPLAVVVSAPYQHLVDQWVDEIRSFGVDPIAVYESSARWAPRVEDALAALRLGQLPVVVFVTTNASLVLPAFQSALERISCPLLFIGDEVHNLGSPQLLKALPPTALYRLGLSATPERFMDPDGTAAIFDYFGPIVCEVDLGEAIRLGALCRYEYFPRIVELDSEEVSLYADLSAQIAARLAAGDSLEDASADSALGLLLRKRSGVLGHAAGKLPTLQRDLMTHASDWYQLVYCAEGRRPGADNYGQPGDRQIEDVTMLIGEEMGLAAHRYVAETPRQDRRALLRRFQTGNDLRFLIAMKCLDEGVDIPDARVAYILASSSNPRQFIQRRGRLLRISSDPHKRAIIYDYLAVPPDGSEPPADFERKLVKRELERADEFGRLSDNYAETLNALRPLRQRYGLMDV